MLEGLYMSNTTLEDQAKIMTFVMVRYDFFLNPDHEV